ncbi:MAG: EAL domain-containing protein [Acidimicrobiales bacterium]
MQGRLIGVLSPLLAGSYFGALISALERSIAAQGGQAVAVQTLDFAHGDSSRATPQDPARIGWTGFAGFVVIINAAPVGYLRALQEAHKPVVLISQEEPELACPVVLPDNRSGVKQAVEHLLAHGHRRIGFAGDLLQYDIRERYAAYRETLAANGVEPNEELFFATSDNLESGGRLAAEKMIAAHLPSSAVVAATDYVAIGIMSALKQAGYVLPQDQAVVGFDDIAEAGLQSPSLSSVSPHFEQIGALAVELLSRQLQGEVVPAAHYSVATSYVRRESCGCSDAAAASVADGAERDPVEGFVGATSSPSAPLDGTSGEIKPASFDHSSVAEVVEKVKRVFETALAEEIPSSELLSLGNLAQRLYGYDATNRGYVRALVLVCRLASEASAKAASPEAADRVATCRLAAELGLSKALVSEQARLDQAEHEVLANETNVSLALLNSHESDPRLLGWLAQSTARAGLLALWSVTGKGRALSVVGNFDSKDGCLALPSQLWAPEDFPPTELLERAREEPGTMCFVMPVRSAATDWGFLAVVGPTETSFTGRAVYYQWSSLLSLALDHQATTESLRRRTEELATSFEREKEMAQAVRQSEERYALAASAANDGLWDWDLLTGHVYYSSRWKQILGYGEDAIGTSPEEWLGRVHPEDRPGLLRAIAEHRDNGGGAFEHEHRVRASDGGYRWVLCRGLGVAGYDGSVVRMVGSLTGIDDKHAMAEKLKHQALHDSLTGLPNRLLFLDRLSQVIAHARRRPGFEYAVLWLDLDGFKVVNDSLGHVAGDLLLKKVAERLAAQVREEDTAARFGGDEFAVLLHDAPDLAAAEAVVERIQQALGQPYDLGGQEVVVTASIGISTSANGYERAEDVIRDADIAMYKAKAAGRGNHAAFDASMYAGALARLRTETELRRAMELDELEIYYQPIVQLGSKALTGMEALVRWRHPERGLLPPGEFLPVAEDSGLIVPIGRWVQERTCRQVRAWKSAGLVSEDLRVSINLSNREFWYPGLVKEVDEVLARTAVPATWIVLEITEGVIMRDLEGALGVLRQLHERGFGVHIDDFGTGYSSLEALHRLPIDALKIDRGFVADLADEGRSNELVRTIVHLGHSLGLDVIAEGIETPEQYRVLSSMGCPEGQGYWFSFPVPAVQLEKLLRHHASATGNGAADVLADVLPSAN